MKSLEAGFVGFSRRAVGMLVDPFPLRWVGPHSQLEALDQAVIVGTGSRGADYRCQS